MNDIEYRRRGLVLSQNETATERKCTEQSSAVYSVVFVINVILTVSPRFYAQSW